MKYVVLILSLSFLACSKNSTPCISTSGSAVDNGQTVQLVNGVCTMQVSPGSLTVNGKNINVESATICGEKWGYLYNQNFYNSSVTDPSSPTGFIQFPDDYYVVNQGTNTQCWFKVTNGELDPTAAAPTF